MTAKDVTPLVLTFNEAPNIARCLERLSWASRIVVVDSVSTDETARLVRGFPNAELHERRFDNHTAQWNFGVDLVQTPWVLSLDADYMLNDHFNSALLSLTPSDEVDAYYVPFRYCIQGQPLSSCLYPPRAALFQKDRCRYVEDGHTQLLSVQGKTATLSTPIDHDDRKPLSRWLWAQDRYAALEATKLLGADPSSLRLQDRLRLWMAPAPMVAFVYTLFARGLIRDGWRGWYYVFQRTLAEILLSLHLLEHKLGIAKRTD
jgi:glycosyltransferase involved in cell wall biosynthesis